MTTTDFGATPPPPPPPPSAPLGSPPPPSSSRVLRRNRTNRVGAGVAGGLGDYFGVDPVLFRVLFATAAFFGGAGVIAYLLAWAAIPEEGTAHAPIDRFIGELRRRRVPTWLVALVAGVLLWAAAFSWWAPGPFLPVVAVVILLVVFVSRRDLRSSTTGAPAFATGTAPTSPATASDANDPTGRPTVDLTKPAPAGGGDQPKWTRDVRGWLDEARSASRARQRRALPVKLTVLGVLAVTLGTLGAIDAASGISLQWYFWSTLMIVAAGLLIGAALRRTPISTWSLLIPAAAGAIAFAGSHASLHDGIGQHDWTPTTTPASSYRLAFGQGVLDLRSLPAQTTPRTIRVTMGAGQVQVIAPKSMNLTVQANIHIGQLQVDRFDSGEGHGGVGLSRIVAPPTATGAPITVDVHLADGNITVDHR